MTLASQVDNATFRVGASESGEHFTGYMSSMRMYDYALTQEEIRELMEQTNPKADR